jgi:hypothetical protein
MALQAWQRSNKMMCDQPPVAVAFFQGHDVAAAHLHEAPTGFEVGFQSEGGHAYAPRYLVIAAGWQASL